MTETPCPPLEATPVGKALCLFRPDTGALGLLNEAARAAFEAAGAQSLRRLPAAAATPLLRPAGPARVECWPDEPDTAAALDVVIAANSAGTAVRFRCHVPWLSGLLGSVLAPLRAPEGSPASIRLTLAGLDDGSERFLLWRDGRAVGGAIRRAEIRRRALIEIAMALHEPNRVAAMLHASAVTVGDGALLIAGRSGAGKSSLTAALTAAGAAYLGDDLAPLDADGRRLHPFPLAVSVKAGSWDRVAEMFPMLREQTVHTIGDLRVRYLPFPRPKATGPVPIRCIIFSSFEPGMSLTSRILAPEEAFALLVDAGSEIVGGPPSAAPLAKLAQSVPAMHLAYADTGEAAAAIRAVGVMAE